MDCCSDNMHGLRYDGISLVFMQIFSFSEDVLMLPHLDDDFIDFDPEPIDDQIFQFKPDSRPVKRYRLKGFNFSVNLDEPYEVSIKGRMHVEISLFFDRTVSLTYRMVVDGEKENCSKNAPLTTDHVIALASLALGAEHWSQNEGDTQTNINLEVPDIEISDFHIDENGHSVLDREVKIECEGEKNAFTTVSERYRSYIHNRANINDSGEKALFYTYVDIWESVQHYDGLFPTLKEEDIISHIFDYHKKELVGLMSLYPEEWPYRTEESFEDVCGGNVAIDTDDLILVNESMAVCFGTYGLRGGKEAPTDWAEHLKERSHFHVSWPEYLLILEMVLAKKHTISSSSDLIVDTMLSSNVYKSTADQLEAHSRLRLDINRMLMKLDAVKYSKFISHKVMFERTTSRLRVSEDEERLSEVIERVDTSLNNIVDMQSLKQDKLLNMVLGAVSVAGLLQVIFSEAKIEFLDLSGINSRPIAIIVGWLTLALMLIGLVCVPYIFLHVGEKKKTQKKKNKKI